MQQYPAGISPVRILREMQIQWNPAYTVTIGPTVCLQENVWLFSRGPKKVAVLTRWP